MRIPLYMVMIVVSISCGAGKEKRCIEGDFSSCIALIEMYVKAGKYNLAKELSDKACGSGVKKACCSSVSCLLYRAGNLDQGKEIMLKECNDDGDFHACMDAGKFALKDNWGTPLKYFKKVCTSDEGRDKFPNSCLFLAMTTFDDLTEAQMQVKIRRACMSGSAEACWLLAIRLHNTWNTFSRKRDPRAFRYLRLSMQARRKACKYGNHHACFILGLYYSSNRARLKAATFQKKKIFQLFGEVFFLKHLLQDLFVFLETIYYHII